jgi:hypothetical protein
MSGPAASPTATRVGATLRVRVQPFDLDHDALVEAFVTGQLEMARCSAVQAAQIQDRMSDRVQHLPGGAVVLRSLPGPMRQDIVQALQTA